MPSLDRIIAQLARADIDAEAPAGEITTVFGNQRLFTDSVRDFHAYLADILTRYDLGGEEYAQFKQLLLVYIDLISPPPPTGTPRPSPAASGRSSTGSTCCRQPSPVSPDPRTASGSQGVFGDTA